MWVHSAAAAAIKVKYNDIISCERDKKKYKFSGSAF